MTDLDIIKQLEKEIGRTLEPIREDMYYYGVASSHQKTNFYTVNEHQKVRRLNIDSNGFSEIPYQVFSLLNLSNLSVAHNNLEKLPNEIKRLEKLHSLTVSNNQLKGLPFQVKSLIGLSSLFLGNNLLKELPKALKHLINLKILYLHGNQIGKLSSEIGQINKLESLSLDGNQLEEIPFEIGKLTSLKELDLHSNKLKKLPKELCSLKKLEKLNLSHNLLEELPNEFCQLPHTLELKIEENHNLVNPPLELALQGMEAICIKRFTGRVEAPDYKISSAMNIITPPPVSNTEIATGDFLFKENKTPALGVESLAKLIVDQISEEEMKDEQCSIGIFGKWGRGKSFLIEQIEKQLDKQKFQVVKFQAWHYQDTPASWAYLYEKFAEQYYKPFVKEPFKVKRVADYIDICDSWLEKNKLWIIGIFIIYLICIWFFSFYKYPSLLWSVPIGIVIFAFIPFQISYKNKTCVKDKIIEMVKTSEIKRKDCGVFGFLSIFMSFTPKNKAINLFNKFFTKHSFQNALGMQAEILKELKQLLETWIPDPTEKKILLVVDDIDRCSEDKIIDIVDALRIMLENKDVYQRVVVISAIDEEILRRAVKFKYSHVFENSNGEDKQERKFITEYIDKLFLIGLRLQILSTDEKKEILDVYTQNKREPAQETPKKDESKEPENNIPKEGNEPTTEPQNIDGVNQQNKSDKYEISNDEYEKLCERLRHFKNATPREIRIFYYRYLLARKLLLIELGDTEITKLSPYVMLFIIKRAEFDNREQMEHEIQSEDGTITIYGEQMSIPRNYEILLKVIDIVVAY